jgi:hypothetical protein
MTLICESETLESVPQISESLASESLVAVEVQLPESVFRQFQQALDKYDGHSADSLFAAAISNYLALLKVFELNDQQEQFDRLIRVLESCCLSQLDLRPPS